MINKIVDTIINTPPYNRLAHRIKIEVDTTDRLNTYGFKSIVNCSIIEVRSICVHCKILRGSHPKYCAPDRHLHNFKQLFVPIITMSDTTVEKALERLLNEIRIQSQNSKQS